MSFERHIRSIFGISYLFEYPCSNTSICSPIKLFFQKGTYKFELWGAGVYSGGGYTSGEIHIYDSNTVLYLYIGGKAQTEKNSAGVGGYNGGGSSLVIGPTGTEVVVSRQYGGSGATDIRLNEELSSRIIVAGGAGGGKSSCLGGHGGGLVGGDGDFTDDSRSHYVGKGGGQNSGGDGHYIGEFGIGAASKPNLGTDFSGSGGGGWYGGGSGFHIDLFAAGGGGSSFINGHPECNITSLDFRFHNPIIIPGNETMPSPTDRNMFMNDGNQNNGFARITCIDKKSTCSISKIGLYIPYIYIILSVK